MARRCANESFPLPVVEKLRKLGHDVLTTSDAGKAGQGISDEDVLAFATFERPAVLTLNRKHSRRLHQVDPNPAGIVICTDDPKLAAQAARIDPSLASIASLSGQLIRVNRPPR